MPRKRPPKGHIIYALGDIIQQTRVKRGITQVQLAALCGVGVTTVAYWEQGLHEPGMDQLKRLAQFFDMPLSVFLSPLDTHEVPLEREPDGRARWRRERIVLNPVEVVRIDEHARLGKEPLA